MARTVRFDVLATAKAVGFDEADRKIQHLSGTAKKSMSGLVVAAAALAPALIPIAAAATGLGGIAVAGGVAVLAIKGIQKEMKDGTPIGQAYTANLATLKGNLTELEHTAAGGVLTGFKKSVAQIQPLMPALNRDTALYSSQLGEIAGNTGVALVTLFHRFEPLFAQFNQDLVAGSVKLAAWAKSSTGVSSFVAYAQAQLPKVEQFFGTLAVTVGHLAQGFAPFGGFILSDLTAFSKVVNAIPIPVLKVAAPAVISLVVAMKAMQVAAAVAPGIIKLNSALVGFAAAETTVGAASLALARTLGPAAVAIAAIVAAAKGMDDISQKFKKDSFLHDVFDPHNADILKTQATGLDGLRTAYWSLHDGVSGTAQQLLDWGSKAENAHIVTTRFATSGKDLNKALADLRAQVGPVSGGLDDMGTAAAASAAKQKTLTGEMNKVKDSAFSVTAQLGFLNAALDKLSNNSIDAEQSELQLKDSLANLVTQAKANGHSLDENTAKGRANKEGLLSIIQGINAHAVAVGKQTGSVGKATTALKTDEAALRSSMTQAGYTKKQIDNLIAAYAATPKQVATAIRANTINATRKLASLQAQLDHLRGKDIVINTIQSFHTIGAPNAGAGGKLAIRDSGGPVVGGTPYLIGLNRRPEIFVPEQSGQVMPIGSGGGRMSTGGTTINLTVNAGLGTDGSAVGRQIIGIIERAFASGETVAGGRAAMR